MRIAKLLALLLLLAAGPAAPAAAAEDDLCQPRVFEDAVYTVCIIDLRESELRLHAADEQGVPLGSFSALEDYLQTQGRRLVFAMNAGMYDEGLKPIGLYVENGIRLHKANTRDGYGNFHLKPNGVFYIAQGQAGVMETGAFLKSGIKPDFATQSGPMLVIDGKLHPKFGPQSTSYKKRNGVGMVDKGRVVFAISESGVTFHAFARFFRDELGAMNALFLDGSISSLHYGGRSDGFFPLGPIVAVSKPQ
jgi:uncharacterized protein YigE (DUF2233 family)